MGKEVKICIIDGGFMGRGAQNKLRFSLFLSVWVFNVRKPLSRHWSITWEALVWEEYSSFKDLNAGRGYFCFSNVVSSKLESFFPTLDLKEKCEVQYWLRKGYWWKEEAIFWKKKCEIKPRTWINLMLKLNLKKNTAKN